MMRLQSESHALQYRAAAQHEILIMTAELAQKAINDGEYKMATRLIDRIYANFDDEE